MTQRSKTPGTITYAGLAGVLLLTAATSAFFGHFPVAGPPKSLEVSMTPALEERGKYLAEHVAICVDCHSSRDPSRYSAPVVPGTLGQGGFRFGPEMGLPGEIYARNITPAGIGDWSDGEVLRAMTEGVSRDGTALFPLMPYKDYAKLCQEDAAAILSYVRKLRPIENEVPKTRLDFPMNLLVRTLPAPAELSKDCPDGRDEVARGAYLVSLSGCQHCHTPQDQGRPRPGLELAGGVPFPMPMGGVAHSANLTPDRETGIGAWTREMFVSRFKLAGTPSDAQPVQPGHPNTIMPWTQYSGMTEEDLGAIFSYLRTVPPVYRPVVRFEAPVAMGPEAPETVVAGR